MGWLMAAAVNHQLSLNQRASFRTIPSLFFDGTKLSLPKFVAPKNVTKMTFGWLVAAAYNHLTI